MLQHIMTDEIFRNGLVKYLHAHQFSSATSDDLWVTLQAALDESKLLHDDYKLKEVMDTWLKQSGYPVVMLSRDYDTGETILTQYHFRLNVWEDHEDNKWWIPLTFATKTNHNFSNTAPTHWLKPQDQNITINGFDPNDWIIVNLQQMGYYLVNYDEKNWKRIADYLNSDEYTEMHILNRAQIISDAFLFLTTNQFPVSVFFDLMNYIPRETDYIAWYPVFTIFKTIWNFYNIPENKFQKAFKPYLNQILDEFIKKIGYEENSTDDDLTKLTRIKVLQWACTFDHFECKQMATIKLNEHLTDPEIHKIPINLEEWIYCMGMMEANISIWNKMLDAYLENPTNRMILRYLSCSKNPDIIANFLNITAANNSIINDDDHPIIYYAILSKHINNDLIIENLLNNIKKNNISRKVSTIMLLYLIISNTFSEQQLQKRIKFLENYLDNEHSTLFQKIIKRQETHLFEFLQKYAVFYSDIFSE